MSNLDILAACVSLEGDAETYRRLRDLAEHTTSWASFPAEAERHGMGPLAYRHLQDAGVCLPTTVSMALMGSYLRHRHDNQVRARVLAQVVGALEADGIPVIVVKGGALAHLLYPDPALRPMSDLDLLVDTSDLDRAAGVLRELGMGKPAADAGQHGKGLSTAGVTIEDTWVGIELHSDLFEEGFPVSMTLRDLDTERLTFPVGDHDLVAQTLGLEPLLWHLCLHLRFHTTVFLPWRLVWITDIVGIAEERAGHLDWGRVHSYYPQVLDTLSLIDCLCPLPPSIRTSAGLERRRLPVGVGEEFDGWPRHSISGQHNKGLARILADTLGPSEWWLRLHYGLSADAPCWRQRYLLHPVAIIHQAASLLRERRQQRFPIAQP